MQLGNRAPPDNHPHLYLSTVHFSANKLNALVKYWVWQVLGGAACSSHMGILTQTLFPA